MKSESGVTNKRIASQSLCDEGRVKSGLFRTNRIPVKIADKQFVGTEEVREAPSSSTISASGNPIEMTDNDEFKVKWNSALCCAGNALLHTFLYAALF